jgi:hypothetical protein
LAQKRRAYNVDEIDTWNQFYQPFFALVFPMKLLFSSYVLATKSTFVREMLTKNVDEIDTWPAVICNNFKNCFKRKLIIRKRVKLRREEIAPNCLNNFKSLLGRTIQRR